MCFDKRVSFLAWAVGTGIALALINRNQNNDQWMAFFILIVVLIQLFEAVVWHAIETKNKKLNDTATRLILVTLVLQPLILMYGAFKWGNAGESLIAKVMFLLIVMNVVYNVLRATKSDSKFKSIVGPNGHLVWKTKDPDESKDICSGNIEGMYTVVILAGFKCRRYVLKAGVHTRVEDR